MKALLIINIVVSIAAIINYLSIDFPYLICTDFNGKPWYKSRYIHLVKKVKSKRRDGYSVIHYLVSLDMTAKKKKMIKRYNLIYSKLQEYGVLLCYYW